MKLIYILLFLILIIGLYWIYKNTNMASSQNRVIQDGLALRSLSQPKVKEKFEMTKEHVEENLSYERLTSMTKLYNPNNHPGHFYFRDNQLKMLYINAENLDTSIDFSDIKATYGEGKELRSRAGKFPHWVYPEHGFAVSEDGDQVVLIEIFPNTTLEKYLSDIYVEPPKFRK